MNQYLEFIFENFTFKSSSPEFNTLLKEQLLSLKPVDLTKLYKPLTSSQTLFNELNLLLAKGVIKYSPSNCTIELSLPNIMFYQRLSKACRFADKYLDKNVAEFVNDWIQQGLQNGMGFPILFEKKKLEKAFSFKKSQQQQQNQQQSRKKPKTNKKQQQTTQQKIETSLLHYNYHKLVYEYKSRQKLIVLEQKSIPEQKPSQNVQSKKPKASTISKQVQQKQKEQLLVTSQATVQQYMLNVQQLTRLLQASRFLQLLNFRLGPKEKHWQLFQFLAHEQKQQLMQEIRFEKIQEFIAQNMGQDCLLVFNLIRKYPFVTEKQLIKLTLMDVLETRASLNKLVEKGLVYFYNENARTMVYKLADFEIIQQKYLDMIAMTILNLSLAGDRISESAGIVVGVQKVKNKLLELECEIQRLDDLMLLFGC